MTYSAICTRPDGQVVTCEATSQGLTFRFPEGPISVAVPTTPMFLSVASDGVNTVAIGKAHEGSAQVPGGWPFLIFPDGRIEAIDPGPGDIGVQSVWAYRNAAGVLMAAWVRPGGFEWSQRPALGGDVITHATGLPGTSQGWLGIRPSGAPVWTDQNRAATQGDFTVTLPVIDALSGWRVGQSNNFFGVAAIDPQGALWIVRDSTPIQVPAQAVVGPDGQVSVAISFDSGPFVVPQSAFVKFADASAPAEPTRADPAPAETEAQVNPPGLLETFAVQVASVYKPNKKGEFRFTVKAPKGSPAPTRGQTIQIVK